MWFIGMVLVLNLPLTSELQKKQTEYLHQLSYIIGYWIQKHFFFMPPIVKSTNLFLEVAFLFSFFPMKFSRCIDKAKKHKRDPYFLQLSQKLILHMLIYVFRTGWKLEIVLTNFANPNKNMSETCAKHVNQQRIYYMSYFGEIEATLDLFCIL